MIIAKTPFRISFFGGGTDYPLWYRKNEGAVLSTTINKYCYLTCRYLPPFFKHKSRIVYSKMELVHNNGDIYHPSVRECLRFLNIEQGVEIHHDADLPARSGIGSSSAFTVGLLSALYALKKQKASKKMLCQNAIHVEQDLIRENVGSQDQTAAVFGGINHIQFKTNNDIVVTSLNLSQQRLNELKSHLLLIFTSLSRTASEVVVEQLQNIPKREKELRIMKEMVGEGIQILRHSPDITHFGKLLHEGWKLKRTLSSQISTPMIDEIYNVARESGALGGKILGAGAGGFLLLFARPQDHPKILGKLKPLIHAPFEFDVDGSRIIFNAES